MQRSVLQPIESGLRVNFVSQIIDIHFVVGALINGFKLKELVLNADMLLLQILFQTGIFWQNP